MKESITQRVLKGEKIYPYMGKKVICIEDVYDLTEYYKKILKQSNIMNSLKEKGYKKIDNFKEFKRLLWEDNTFLNIIKGYFNVSDSILISDKQGEKIFVVRLKEKEDKPYTLKLAQMYCEMNRENFFNDYKDVFSNEIIFK